MTKEEAIKIINCYDIGFYDLSGEKIPADKLAEAFDMAIEALKEKKTKAICDYDDCKWSLPKGLYRPWKTCVCYNRVPEWGGDNDE